MAALTVLACLLIWAGGWLSYSFAGTSGTVGLNSDSAYPPFARVTYALTGYEYWGGGQMLTGPHRPLAWALGWLGLSALAWGIQARRHGGRFRWGFRVSGAALLLSLLTCLLVLPAAQSAHTRFVQQHPNALIGATITTLDARAYSQCMDSQGCIRTELSVFLNPFVVSTVALAVAGVLAPNAPRRWRSTT